MVLRLLVCALFSTQTAAIQAQDSVQYIAVGHLPVVSADQKETFHAVFGRNDTIYYTTANRLQPRFDQPVAIAVLPQLVAGAKRGPQVAITEQYVVITASNRAGNLFAYSMNRRSGQWSSATQVNDVAEVAKEGFQAVAGSSAGLFHATWLDLRENRRNKIVMATSRDGGRKWSTNRVVYTSPSGSVCECCKVSVAAKENHVYIQFRNWMNGSRDLYLAHSADGGATFAPAQKMGTGTWKLNACPMDGGAVTLTPTGQPITVWRRENTLYTCRPGEPEQAVGTGRNVTSATGSWGTVLAWDEGGVVWLKRASKEPMALGRGQMPSVACSGKSIVCLWEADGKVMVHTAPL